MIMITSWCRGLLYGIGEKNIFRSRRTLKNSTTLTSGTILEGRGGRGGRSGHTPYQPAAIVNVPRKLSDVR